MKIYEKNIVEIYNTFIKNEEFFPGIRWAFDEIKDDTDYIILGINPSNSFSKLEIALKNAEDDQYKFLVKKLKLKKEEVTEKIKKIVDEIKEGIHPDNQKNYNDFLHNKFNRDEILFLQEIAHEYHDHFKKHKILADALGVKKYQFMDLFPIWCVDQTPFLNELKKEVLAGFKDEILMAFNSFVSRHKTAKGLLFFNGKAGELFLKSNDTKEFKIEPITVRYQVKGKQKTINSKVNKHELKIDKRKISVLVFPIGNVTFKNESALIDLGKKSKVLI